MKKMLMTIMLVVLSLLCSVTQGMSLVGPSTTLQKGEVELSYDHTETTQNLDNLLPENTYSYYDYGDKDIFLEDVKFDLSTISLSYGVTDTFEVSIRYGSAAMEGDRKGFHEEYNDYGWCNQGWQRITGTYEENYSLNTNLFGIGAKANLLTFYENVEKQEKLSAGVALQGNWMNLKGDVDTTSTSRSESEEGLDWDSSFNYSHSVVIDLFEGRVALGTTYTKNGFSIYGGPAVQYLTGTVNDWSQKKLRSTKVLGYIGSEIELSDNIAISGEYQFGRDYETFGMGTTWKF